MARILKYWDLIRSSFWLVPSLLAAGAVALAFAMVALDRAVTTAAPQAWDWAYTGGAEGASVVLGTIAGSMITIAGVVFSMTLVVLSLASGQLGPRLLRNFMRDTSNQLVLGTFVATFVYCLLVLRTVRRGAEDLFVPHLSVTAGVVLALISLGVLIYFIHHVSVSIQADVVVARVGEELIEGIDRLFPERIGHAKKQGSSEPHDAHIIEVLERDGRPVMADADGYVQRIDPEELMTLATQEDVLIRVERAPGQYVMRGTPLATISPASRVTDRFGSCVNSAFALGDERTDAQDVEYAVHQLVEIAVRALSPGINDPFTAVACVNRLGSGLLHLAQREIPSPYRRDAQQRMRIVAAPFSFTDIVDASFNQIRQHSGSSAAVTLRLLEVIAVVGTGLHRPEDRLALRRHAEMIVRGARTGLPEAEDMRAVEKRFETASTMLQSHDVRG